MQHFAVLIALLRDRDTFLAEIRDSKQIEAKIISLIIASSIFLAIYGAIIGSSSSWQQLVVSAVKLPALYLLTLLICLPTLFFFDILFGSKLDFKQYAALSLTTVAVISVLLFAFAPITLFFLISIHDYTFFLLLNVAILGLTGIIGVKLFYSAVLAVVEPNHGLAAGSLATGSKDVAPTVTTTAGKFITDDVAPPPSPQHRASKARLQLLQFWLVLYGLVGSQLGWTLRPFFGAPGEPFQLFRDIEGNFYQQVIRLTVNLLTGA